MIFKCPYSIHILSSTKNAFRKLFIFFNKNLYTILPKYPQKSSKFCVKKNVSHQFFNFFQNPCAYLFFIQKRSFARKDFPKNIFWRVTFFWGILYLLHEMTKFSKKRRKIYQKIFLTRQLELWRNPNFEPFETENDPFLTIFGQNQANLRMVRNQ